ncbi:MAG: lipopolysaccharide kinase InaA family protein [Planctomycetota bacterium]
MLKPNSTPIYAAETWRKCLVRNDAFTFEALWNRPESWIESPNEGRGGWSGVKKISLDLPAGTTAEFFLKCQENYASRSWRHPIFGELTFAREFRNLREFSQLHLPTPELIYFDCDRAPGRRRALLMTTALPDRFLSLEEWMLRWQQKDWPEAKNKSRIIKAIAHIVRRMHEARFQHNGLYPKHIFLSLGGAEIEIRLIDLEKTRQRRQDLACLRDLDTLNRRTKTWTDFERLRFLIDYFGPDADHALRSRTLAKLMSLREAKAKRR